ncbi:hypothetical protein [Chamaesiphon polymorphus]|uniref:Peptidase A2 domain-containing protein n=1 Tax=Chamaesiphon polymorphus CCALA 037 TaxID=2107692 RepID=A0A2T1G5K3_9CYAN|nr:hypothetical protein [Chamaesiphon polymorphus]PSB52514.1 hypothetical protein C7B77_20460 [Chamaesiphon polymorphus CCALA 037]
MGTYRYISLGTDIPAIPIVPLELIQPGKFDSPSVVGQAIVDTGSDCTLVPLPWLIQVNAQIADRALRIPVCGQLSLAIPHEVGIRFDKYRHFVFRVYGCSVDDIGEMVIVVRDILNLYRELESIDLNT